MLTPDELRARKRREWQEKAAKEIQCEIAMGDMPQIEDIIAIIDKHFQTRTGATLSEVELDEACAIRVTVKSRQH